MSSTTETSEASASNTAPAAPANDAAASPPATDTASTAAPAAQPAKPAGEKPQLMFNEESKPEDAKAEGEEGGKKDGEDVKEGEGKDQETKPAVEYTDFTVPEGMQVVPEHMEKFKSLAAAHNLPQEAAQAFLDAHVDVVSKMTQDWEDTKDKWAADFEADEKLGGKNLQTTLGICNDVVRRFGDADLVKDLKELGLGNKLSLGRFFVNIHNATKEDQFVADAGGTTAKEVPAEEKLYPRDRFPHHY